MSTTPYAADRHADRTVDPDATLFLRVSIYNPHENNRGLNAAERNDDLRCRITIISRLLVESWPERPAFRFSRKLMEMERG